MSWRNSVNCSCESSALLATLATARVYVILSRDEASSGSGLRFERAAAGLVGCAAAPHPSSRTATPTAPRRCSAPPTRGRSGRQIRLFVLAPRAWGHARGAQACPAPARPGAASRDGSSLPGATERGGARARACADAGRHWDATLATLPPDWSDMLRRARTAVERPPRARRAADLAAEPEAVRQASRASGSASRAVPATACRPRWRAARSSASTRRRSPARSASSACSPTPTTSRRKDPSGAWRSGGLMPDPVSWMMIEQGWTVVDSADDEGRHRPRGPRRRGRGHLQRPARPDRHARDEGGALRERRRDRRGPRAATHHEGRGRCARPLPTREVFARGAAARFKPCRR